MANKFDLATLVPTTIRNGELVLDFPLSKIRYLNQYMSTENTRTHIVQSFEDGRADLISFSEYGTTEYWWIILMLNGLVSTMDLVSGIQLNLPSIVQIETYLQIVNSIDKGQSGVIRK